MSTNEMDYFAQRPDLDLKPFFEGKAVKRSSSEPVAAGAPPPKDTYWVAEKDIPAEEEE